MSLNQHPTALDELANKMPIDARLLEKARAYGEFLRKMGLLKTDPTTISRPFNRDVVIPPKPWQHTGWSPRSSS